MIHGLVLTHGGVGAGLIDVVGMILGEEEGLSAMSNEGLSLKDLTEQTEARLAEAAATGAEGTLIFIDDVAGSCATAARLAVGDGATARIVSGVNLAMLLDFLTWRESLDLEELTRRVVGEGRHAIAEVAAIKPGEAT